MNSEKTILYDLNYERVISPESSNTKIYLEDSCRAVLCGCFSCQMRARKNFLRRGIPIPTKKEAREILGITKKRPTSLRVYYQISEILEKKKFG